MAGPNEVRSAYRVESGLRKIYYDTMEAEERTTLLESLVGFGLSTKEVISFLGKQNTSRRCRKIATTGEILMKEKLKDSRWEEEKFRGERAAKRKELESLLGKSSNKFKRILSRIKEKVKNARKTIRCKNKEKITRYKERQKTNKVNKELKNLRVFKGEKIEP